MLTLEKLKECGIDTNDGLKRCMNNEAFYLRLVNMALDDGVFDRMRAAVESGDVKEIFEAAHAMKGMLGNLSLTPLVTPASEMTELARGGCEADYSALWDIIRTRREELLSLRDEA